MVLVDVGNGGDIEFGHTDYYTGEGRPVTHSENQKERYVNPKLTVEERTRVSMQDTNRRNRYAIYLLNENITQILEFVQYNPFTEALSLTWQVKSNNGKRLLDITDSLDNRSKNLRSGLEVPGGLNTPISNIVNEVKQIMKKEKEEGEGASKYDVTVKISGDALKQVMAVRVKREKRTGRITSMIKLVREAIECWYDREAGDE